MCAKRKGYTDEDIKNAVAQSTSFRQVLMLLGLIPAGGNYDHLKKVIKAKNIDTSHFLGKGWLKNKTHNWVSSQTRLLQDILQKDTNYSPYKLKNRLLKANIKEARCELCSNTEWLGKSIALELHHKDGDSKNNLLENLMVICPNCHAQTTNYRGKAKRKYGNTHYIKDPKN